MEICRHLEALGHWTVFFGCFLDVLGIFWRGFCERFGIFLVCFCTIPIVVHIFGVLDSFCIFLVVQLIQLVYRFVFPTQVTISNESQQLIQVLSRHWIVTDATGKTFQVGPKAYGVVGQQPMLRPGESFRYTSLCPLATELGTMHGSFEILILEPVQMNGQRFQAEIGRFGLTLKGEDAMMPIVIGQI